MKLRNLIFVLGLICGFSAFAFGIKPPPHCDRKPVEKDAEAAGHFPPPPPAGAISGEDARLLKSLFLMSDAELKRLREFIQHLERIAPE